MCTATATYAYDAYDAYDDCDDDVRSSSKHLSI